MKIISRIQDWKVLRERPEFHGRKVGFVPTMGALHDGHLSLFKRSLSENDLTIASIFVNPTQFNNPSDLQNYPRPFESDVQMLQQLGVQYLFSPCYEEMYPDNFAFKLVENQISPELCGKFRPGHFDGVLTVVMKLFNLVKPDRAYFGEKDFQQLMLIKEMVKAFFIPVEVVNCPTVREESGLAMSSRNTRLSVDDKQRACQFARLLRSEQSLEEIKKKLDSEGFTVDYIEEKWGRRFGAVHVGAVRLIDNVKV